MKLRTFPTVLSLALVIGIFSLANPSPSYSTMTSVSSCSATLDGDQEVPPVVTDGTGNATMEFDPSTNELSWTIDFSDLSGAATAAHFHGPAAAGANADVQVNIGDVSGLESPMDGSAELTSEQVTMLLDEELYINIHTGANPSGEIRGQVSCESAPDEGPPPDEGPTATTTVTVEGQEFELEYSISGGTLDEVTADPTTQTLMANISSTSDGNLTLWLPTDLIDSEDDFSVFIDGEFGNFVVDELDPTEAARVLQIEFPLGAEEIEIVGTSMAGGGEEPQRETITVVIGAQTYDIMYEITGGSVDSVTADVNATSLSFAISPNETGTLTLWLPTEVIDSDNEFTVLVDGSEGNFTEQEPTATARVLQIEFNEDSQETVVVGTFMVPEFGSWAILAMSAVTAGAIIATRRFHRFGGLGR